MVHFGLEMLIDDIEIFNMQFFLIPVKTKYSIQICHLWVRVSVFSPWTFKICSWTFWKKCQWIFFFAREEMAKMWPWIAKKYPWTGNKVSVNFRSDREPQKVHVNNTKVPVKTSKKMPVNASSWPWILSKCAREKFWKSEVHGHFQG